MNSAVFPAVICGKREFAWRWTRIEGGKEVRWQWVVRLQAIGGILPTYRGEVLTHTTMVPFSYASPITQFKHDLKGKIMNFTRTHRVALTVFLWLVAVECITVMVSFIFGYPPEFGGFRVGLPMPLYIPGAFLAWGDLIDARYSWMINAAMFVSLIVGVALLLRLLFDVARMKGVQDSRPSIYGQHEQARKDHLL